MRYFVLGELPGTLHSRYAILSADHTVTEVTISRPDGTEVERPTHIRWKQKNLAEQLAGVQIKTWRINEQPAQHNGEQARRPTWRRAGRKVAQ